MKTTVLGGLLAAATGFWFCAAAMAEDIGWHKVPNSAQYKSGDWTGQIGEKKRFDSVEEAQSFAAANNNIDYFFYCRAPMYLETLGAKGRFNANDAVFFRSVGWYYGHQGWYGSAPQCDVYEKTPVSDKIIEFQREALAKNKESAKSGPQSPRDIGNTLGGNQVTFASAPLHDKMYLCNIHFHENAEHRGGEFTEYAGNGDGYGNETGYKYKESLSGAELTPIAPPRKKVGESEHGDLEPGDTIEIHYVYSTAKVTPGKGLDSCLIKGDETPKLRVEAQVYVLVNDGNGLKLDDLAEVTEVPVGSGRFQAPNMPTDLGTPVQYAGSTTGPVYNEEASPYQVTWSVHPNVAKVDINSVDTWLKDNIFKETHAHGVRNLVLNPDLLSQIPN